MSLNVTAKKLKMINVFGEARRICKRLERANVGEALLVLSHGDEEKQERWKPVGEHEH